MTEFNMIFYTDYYTDGYQLGINITSNKSLTDNEYKNLYEKISVIFKTNSYGMDIVKIAEIIKIVLSSEEIHEPEILISLVNKKDDSQTDKFTVINKGVLPYDIEEYGLDNDHEIYIIKYNKDKLSHYSYKNITKKLIYDNNEIKFEYSNLSNNSRNRNGSINRFLKNNMETIKKLENVDVPEMYRDINMNDSILISAYKIFYNELPDFNDPYIVVKLQCMGAILHVEGISMFPFCSTYNYHDSKINSPESLYIKDQIFKLNILLGNNISKVADFKFKPYIHKKIELIGETIRNYIEQMPEEEKMPFLNQFTVNYLHSCYLISENIDYKSQELILLLTKKDAKN